MNLDQVICISDIHGGCKRGLYNVEDPIRLDDGSFYKGSEEQEIMWGWWKEFWNKWVPMVTDGKEFGIVINGDSIDGVHHKSVTQISHNLIDQRRIAERILKPLKDRCSGKLWVIRGTEAHVGPSAQDEEQLAENIGAIPNSHGQYARHELWMRLGEGLVHFAHHIGTTSRHAYETSALMAELSGMFAEAGQWGEEAPDCVVRSHRHRNTCVDVPTRNGRGWCIVTPGWQLKTPFVYKLPGGRIMTPQMGGVLIKAGVMGDKIYTMSKVWNIGRPEIEVCNV